MIRIVLIEEAIEGKESIYSLIKSNKNFFVQGLGKDYYDAYTLVKKYTPDILILDTALETNATEIISAINRYSPATKTVIISNKVKDRLIREMARGTVANCLLRDSDKDQLDIILEEICRGRPYINHKINARAYQLLADYLSGEKPKINYLEKKPIIIPVYFSVSEKNILHFLLKGYSGKDIARITNFAEGTVRNYISAIKRKIGAKTHAQMILYALKYGFRRSSGLLPEVKKAHTKKAGDP